MDRRSVVVCVGEDTDVRDRVADAVAVAWGDSRSVEFERVAPAELSTEAEDDAALEAACGVVTTVDALASDAVRAAVAALPDRVPVIVAVDEPAVGTLRTVLEADADDVVALRPDDGANGDVATPGPLVERLRRAVDPALTRLGADGVARLREVLLDAGTTLMSTRSDEVETKTVWTMEHVGRQVDVDRVVCYLQGADAFEPASHWSSEGSVPASRALRDFPDPEALSTFENVARPPISHGETGGRSADADGAWRSGEGYGPDSVGRDGPATVHVPLVADWDLIGVLALETDESRAWTSEEVAAYRTLGDLIAHTIARNERRLELRRQTERLEQFSAVVSHELRNPLNVLSGYLDLVEDDVEGSSYAAMDRAVHRMETLIDDLLMLARRGDAVAETESVSVAAVAENAWDSIRAPNATLTVADDVDRVEADPGRLRQLFENLFRNAVDHGGPGVDIEVGAVSGRPEERGMYVADDGPGIASDASGSLFDSGFSTAGSSGLGLAIVARIADAHGWEIDVRNDGGAVFEFSFESAVAAAPS
jgi:signal transduction histidine kinase/phosphohistidine swiveling domain-containing protein